MVLLWKLLHLWICDGEGGRGFILPRMLLFLYQLPFPVLPLLYFYEQARIDRKI
jgi:hypothetical protein